MVAAIKYDSKVWATSVVSSWARESGERRGGEAWRELDRQLRAIAARRAALDAEELALIRKAIAIQIWRKLGMTSMREYLEHVMGYGPQVAAERLRVSDALEGLPAIERALGSNELSYSAVRELTRIATRKTEDAWLEASRGKNLRQIEELIAEREPGDGPDAPRKPDLRPKRMTVDLLPEAVALMRQAQAALDAVRGERTDRSELLGEAFRCLLAMHAGDDAAKDRGDAAKDRGGRSARAQIATITKCEGCGQGWQLAAGRKIAITAAELERAECDAVHIGSLDGGPQRASSSIPPATERFVMHRDGERCTVPGCRSAQNLEVHHIVHREYGGTNEPSNLTVLCWGHHAAHHRGELHIAGKAPAITVTRSWPVPHVGGAEQAQACAPAERVDAAHAGAGDRLVRHEVPHVGDSPRATRPQLADIDPAQKLLAAGESGHADDVLLALRTLGFTRPEAKRALVRAIESAGADAELEPLMRAALRACPKPR